MHTDAQKTGDALDSLEWQLAMGADEAVVDDPQHDTDWATPQASITPKPPPQPASTPKPAPANPPQQSIPSQAKTDRAKPATPAPDFAATTSIAELADMCLGFDGAADLKRTATQMVFADGNPNADLMLVGEAPGADEDRQGKPFVGASGQLLDKMLATLNLSRKNSDPATAVYISNIVLWRPPGNRTPTTEEINLFLPILRRHIQLATPKVIMCLGKTATQAMLGRVASILQTRGKWHDYDAGDGKHIPLMPSLHPAYLLRSPTQKAKAWLDLRLVYRRLQELRADGLPQNKK